MNPAEITCEPALLEHACGLWQARAQTGSPDRDDALLAHALGWLQDEDSPADAGMEWIRSEQAGDQIGHYTLVEPLGEGGFGVVWMAEQLEPVRRRVALKILKLGMDTREVIARFEQERQALALMDHPHIAKVFDAGATPTGRPYFVMELVQGVPITDYCDRERLSISDRLGLFIAVCHAVQHAHQKGIIHRDLKPSNILVAEHDGVATPKIIDFGVAKATQTGLLSAHTVVTQGAVMLGTPHYMSPEQATADGLDLDTRSDIYALGVLLYELLTGRPPFDPDELMRSGWEEMRRLIREVEPERPSRSRGAPASSTSHGKDTGRGRPFSLDLDWIVMKALEKDRTRRYATAKDFADDLARHLASEPVLARPTSQLYRFRRLVRRNRAVFAASGAVLAALLAGLGTSTYSFFKERAARADATVQRGIAEQSEAKAKRLLYASDMNLAQQSLNQNNLGKARRLLDRHRPQPGEEDLRGWEWRYLWQLSRSSALATLTHRPARGFSLGFSPDGTRLAVGWFDGHVELWDVPRRRLIRALTDREYRHPGQVAFSPVRNLLAATSEPKTVTLYDLDSGRESVLWRVPYQDTWVIRDLKFSQDGSRMSIYAGTPSALIYGGSAPNPRDEAWVVNVSTSAVESRQPTPYSSTHHHGAARLSPDNHRLYLPRSDAFKRSYSIRCIDLTTGQDLWQTEPERDYGVTALDLSPDGRVLANGVAFEDPTIRIRDALTGRQIVRLDGHTGWVAKVAFTRDGRRLISASSDQTIRFWDTSNWNETEVLRGHTDELHALAISEPAGLIASGGKDGDILLWRADGKGAAEGYSRLPDNLTANEVRPLDGSRVLLLPPDKRPELTDLKRDSSPEQLPEITSSADVLGNFGTHTLCHWNGTNQIVVRELVGEQFVERGAITLDDVVRPAGCAYHPARQLLAWSDGSSAASIALASLAAPDHRKELKSEVAGFVPSRFSEDGSYLIGTKGRDTLRVWNIETGQIIASSSGGLIRDATFAAGGRVLVVAIEQGDEHEIEFHDLTHSDQSPRRVSGVSPSWSLAVSPDGALVASSTIDGHLLLFDPAKGELIESLRGHLGAAFGVAFSADGQRLISSSGGREAVKVWDVGTRQELLTLPGTGSTLHAARWSADGDMILAGYPWQAWRAPSWEEIAAADAQVKTETKQR